LIAAILIAAIAIGITVLFNSDSTQTPGETGTGSSNPNGVTPDHIHSFSEWEITEEATCTKVGSQKRSCSCGFIETRSLAKTEHSYKKATEIKNDSNYTVQILCIHCNQPSDFSAHGMFLDNDNTMYLADCPQNFSFNVTSSKGINYIKENLYVCESFYQNIDPKQYPAIIKPLKVETVSNNTYRITPDGTYDENKTYYVALPENTTFAQFPGNAMEFTIKGDDVCEIEYNENILFLKQLEIENPGYYPYNMSLNNDERTYTITLSKVGVFDQNYIGRLICIGDCTNFIEAAQTSSDVVIGKIAAITYENSATKIKLTAPSPDEIYSKLNVSMGGVSLDAEAALSEEYQQYLTEQLLNSESFATALTSVTIAAENFAKAYDLRAVEKEFNLKDLKFKITGQETESTDAGAEFALNVNVKYEHSIPIEKNGTTLGSIDFNIEFDFISTFTLKASTNINLAGLITGKELQLRCELYNHNSIEFDLSADLNMAYTIEVSSAIYYIQNPNSKKIHRSDCRMAANYLNDESTHYYSYKDATNIPNHLANECGICKPFTMSETSFVLNRDTNTLHCGNCKDVKNIKTANIAVYSTCPIGSSATNCNDCNPQEHTKSIENYISESLKDGNWNLVYDVIKNSLGKVFTGDQGGKITPDAKEIIKPRFACFEVPIYVEPQFDFDLKANFALHFDAQREDAYIMQLLYDKSTGYSFDVSHNVIDPNGADEDDCHFTMDLQGKLYAELGVLVQVRLGFSFTSEWCYVAVNGECGMYTDLAGVLHLDSSKESYYAAHIEAGIYCEVYWEAYIVKVLEGKSDYIIEKKKFPFFESGDIKAYQSFLSEDPSIKIDHLKYHNLDTNLLHASYFDLEDMTMKSENLSWSGNSQYSLTFRFVDKNGKNVSYCYVKNGVLYVRDDAPTNFEITLYVGVKDNVTFNNVVEYIVTKQTNGAAFFMDELAIKIVYTGIDSPVTTAPTTTGKTPITTTPSTTKPTEPTDPVFQVFKNLALYEESYAFAVKKGNTAIRDAANGLLAELKATGELDRIIKSHFDGTSTFTYQNPEWIENDDYQSQFLLVAADTEFFPFAYSIDNSDDAFSGIEIEIASLLAEKLGRKLFINSDEYEDLLENLVDRNHDIAVSGIRISEEMMEWVDYTQTYYSSKQVLIVRKNDTVFAGCQTVKDLESILAAQKSSFKIGALKGTMGYAYAAGNDEWEFDGYQNLETIPYSNGIDVLLALKNGEINAVIMDEQPALAIMKILPVTPDSDIGLEYEYDESLGGYVVTGIGSCTDTEVVIPSEYSGKPVVAIGDRAFSGCDRFTNVTIPDSITHVGEYAFACCSSLTSIVIPNSVTSMEQFVLAECKNLSAVFIFHKHGNQPSGWHDGWANFTYLSTSFYFGDEWHYVDGVPTPFYSKGFEFTSNGDGTCFVSGRGTCKDVDIVIPPTAPNGEKVVGIGKNAFYWENDIISVVIPEGVTYIGSAAFYECSKLTKVTIPSTLAEMQGTNIFTFCNISEVHIFDLYAWCQLTFEHSASNPLTGAALYLNGELVEYLVIPDGITTINKYAFDNCDALKGVILSPSTTKIDAYAFYHCDLDYIYIPITIEKIDGYAFQHAKGDMYFQGTEAEWKAKKFSFFGSFVMYYDCDIPTIDTEEESSASQGLEFEYDESLGGYVVTGIGSCTDTDVVIPSIYNGKPVTSIGDDAFFYCTSLTSIVLPDSMTSIGDWAFYNCTSLTSIQIPNSVTSIGNFAFYNCDSFTGVTIGNNVTSIGHSAFCECTSLMSITIGNSVTSIGNYAFRNCTSLASITIPDSVTSIGNYAFYGCSGLTSITFTGTTSQWNTISKGVSWEDFVPVTQIQCSNGTVAL